MESTSAACKAAIVVLSDNNNVGKDVGGNNSDKNQNEKETEMEVDNPSILPSAQYVQLHFSNKPQINSQLQHYFSSFYKEMLWPSSNITMYELVLPGSVSFQLDLKRLFPTVIIHEDKRSKCSIAELLHTIITLSLGKKSIDLCFNKHLFSAMFKISCESNDAVGILLQQFILQIVHYLSSKPTFDVRVPMDFLEMLFQCINCESSRVVKDYISACIKEFLQSFLNLLPKPDRINSAIYHHTIHKIINLATYPSHAEPLTAAYAFNHLYSLCVSPYLNMIAPNKYWLEFLHSFLMNLEKCNEEQVLTALCHIKDTISSRTSIFNAKFPSRRKPLEFPNEKLEGAVTWLFEQCGSLNSLLRCKCMNLFEDLCVHVSNIKSTMDFVNNYGVKNVNRIALRGLSDFDRLDLDNLKALERTLEFYTWIFNKQISTPDAIFAVDKNEKEKMVFMNIFGNFISILVSKNVEDTVRDTTSCATEAKKLLVLINAVVLKIFSFVGLILTRTSNVKSIIKNTWNDNLCLLVSRFTLCPGKLGISKMSLDILDNFFTVVSEHLPCAYLTKFQKNFFADTQEELQNFSNVHHVMALKDDLSGLTYFLTGITKLRTCEFINFEKLFKFTTTHMKESLTNIYETLKSHVVNGNLTENIDSDVIDYLNGVVNFFLLSYKQEQAEFIINLISSESSSTNGTSGTVFFDTFKRPLLEFFMKNPVETLDTLNKILLSSPEKLLLLLESLLEYATNNPSDNSKILADSVIKDCSSYKDLILDIQYHDWLFKINRLAVSLSSDPTTADPLISYVLEEFEKAESAVKRIEIVYGFVRCFIDGSKTSKLHITTMFRKLREERLQASQQLSALIEKLIAMNSWQMWEGIILLTCGACNHFFKDVKLNKHLETYFSGMSGEDAAKIIESIYAIFKDTSMTSEERLDILNYFLLPSVESCNDITALNKFYEDNFLELHDLVLEEMNDSDISLRKHSLIKKVACYRLFEIMYGKLPITVILAYRIELANTKNPTEYLNISLLKSSHEVRAFTAKFDEEKELARLLHCSALNCYIAIVSLQVENTFQNLIFKEARLENQLVWEKIIDCEKKYEFSAAPLEIRIVNVMRKSGDRMRLTLEKDELNYHECMAMIVAIFLNLHDNKIVQTRDTLPDWMINFHGAFNTDKNNVISFLLRVIVNARRAFSSYMQLFFESVAKALCFYIQENKINCLVRDVLLMIVETKCELRNESEIETGQKLIEALIQQAHDSKISVCEYNVVLIEKLMTLWKPNLHVPTNLDSIMESDPNFSIRIIHILLKNEALLDEVAGKETVQKMIKNRMFRWREPLSPLVIEILGYLISCLHVENAKRTAECTLVNLFNEMRRAGSADFCACMFYTMFRCYPSLVEHECLLTYINPVGLKNEECKALCFEMFFETMTNLDPPVILSRLESMKFVDLLNDKTMLPCVEVGFKIIDKLVGIFDAQELLPYARIVEKYATKDALLEHKSNAIWFFIGIYKKYASVAIEESDEYTKNLMTLSEQVLINSVSDPSDEMQEDVLDFWRDSTQLTENTVDRLKRILDMFSLEVHSSYAQFLCLLMLDLTNKYSDNQKLLFGPLTPCNFETQEVVSPRRSRSKSSVQRPTAAQKSKSPTNIDDSARRRIDNADVKLSKRVFPTNEEIDERAFLYPVATRNYVEEYDEKLKAQKLEQDNLMKFNRIYKETYLPDVEINQADVVATIEDYARRCPSYAADLSVSIVCGMLDHFKGTETYNEILESVANMCSKVLKAANDFVPMALEILYKCDCPFDVDDVVKVSKAMDLQSLGILIIEKKSIIYDYTDHYRTGKKFSRELSLNVHLATLYRSIDEPDVVESIFKNWKLDYALDYLREGSVAEVKMDWENAKLTYEEGFNAASGIVKDYCMEGMFECLSKLSSWSEINNAIDEILNEQDYNSIWQHPNKDQLLPWIFKAQLQEKLENLVRGRDIESEFSNHLEAWLYEKGDSITRQFGEELSLFFLCNGDSSTARKCLESVLLSMYEKSTLDESNQQVIAKYERISDIEMYMEAVDKDPLIGTKELMNFWQKDVPEFGDDLLNWNVRLNYRLTFVNLLSKWIENVSMDTGVTSDLLEAGLKQRFIFHDLALKYKNVAVSRKFSLALKKDLEDTNDERFQVLKNQSLLAFYRFSFLQSNIEFDMEKRFSKLVSSWHKANRMIENVEPESSLYLKTCYHIFDVTRAFRSWILSNDSVAHRAVQQDFIAEQLEAESPEELDNQIFHYTFNTLKDILDKGSAKEMAESYTKFSEYCLELMSDKYDRDDALHKEFLFSLLQAMTFGSVRAARYFPCLLKHSIYRENALLSKIFLEKCQVIPSRLFLVWLDEIVSHVTSPLAPKVLPIVKKLCNDYPTAIVFALRNVRENPEADELFKTTFADSKYDNFFDAMEYLCQPEEFLRHRLQEFIYSLSDNDTLKEEVKLMLSKVATNTSLQSASCKKIFSDYKKDIEKFASISDVTVARVTAEQLCEDLRKTMAQRMEKNELTETTKLSYYSPFLNDFSERNFSVDVPIQHNALQQRPKIVRIDRFVRVFPSKSNSLAIKVVGSDGKTYEFLIKCGVDLRQDQKMQRIFKIANQSLKDDLNCCKRNLSVGTYNVVPISNSTGLVQWVPNVKSLEEIVEYSLVDKSIIQSVKEKYEEWIDAASNDETLSESLAYKRSLVKYSAEVVSEKMIELSAGIKPNLIQQSFLQISPSLDSYFKLRQNFVKSYATMCLTHWLFGVGDRRLKNTLVNIFNGDCFGINFALILGASAELPIPELVPFRLTAQIVNFMKPFGERDLFGATMCHVLKALKNDSNLLLGCLDAFLEEPIDWNSKLNVLWKNEDPTHNGVSWSPTKKIEIFKQKLHGTKPSKILTDELSSVHGHAEDQYFSLYQLIVNGREVFHTTARSLMKDHELTPEKQVLCLLDQATDVNTIGRMWSEWKCFL